MSLYLKVFNTLSIFVSAFALRNGMNMMYKGQDMFFSTALFQTFFLLDILNILIGQVKAPILFSILQLASRLFVAWYVCYAKYSLSVFLAGIMFTVWFLSDMIRYFYYLFRHSTLMNLRYSLFIFTYPIGTIIEMRGVYNLILRTTSIYEFYILSILLFLYVPGFCMLYFYMFKQREKSKRKKE